jgi:hypothetical protein
VDNIYDYLLSLNLQVPDESVVGMRVRLTVLKERRTTPTPSRQKNAALFMYDVTLSTIHGYVGALEM